jgi:O-methyltransferase
MTQTKTNALELSPQEYLDLLKSALTASLYEESAWRRVEGPMRVSDNSLSARLKRRVLRFLRKRDLILVRTFQFNPSLRDQGEDWPLFGFTMTGQKRLDALQNCVEQVLSNDILGDFCETGVWRGGSVIFMRALLKAYGITDRIVWCADSFEGMPIPQRKDKEIAPHIDLSDREYLKVSLDQVKTNFDKFGLLDDQVKFLKGWFCDSLPTAPIKHLSLLRLDGDHYESTRDVLVNLYDKVSRGGFVIVDDYGTWKGCRTAVDEFRSESNIRAPLSRIDGSAVMWMVED